MSSRRWYSKRHYQMVSSSADSSRTISERIAQRAICEQAHSEMLDKFSPLTAHNVAEAILWQENRIKELAGSGHAHPSEGV